jgi:dethiobiotin synthetase
MNFFVTGTDTCVGKTLISCALLHGFAGQGFSVVGMKPVACDDADFSEDVRALLAASNVLASRGQINPYSFERAVAPHLAAKFVGVRISLERILQSYSELETQADVVVVEGAGGFRVPLNESQDGADLARQLKLPVILVVGMRLGCLNHALLTADAITRCGLKLAGWVANCVEGEMSMLNENIEALTERIKGPLLGVVPHYQAVPDAGVVAACLDLSLLKH